MALITYEDKQTLNENPAIPDINKCKASDLNEIKQVVNDNYTELAPIFENVANDSGCVTIGKLCIQWGVVSVTPSSQSSAGSYYGSATVSFSKTYKYNPSMMAVAGVGYTSILNVASRNVTTTEGLVFLLAENNTARNCKWLAIGEIA